MKRFTELFQAIDSTTSINEKVKALQAYFATESPENAVWALYLLLGKPRRRLITSRVLREAFLKTSNLPEWLFEDCYAHVGDSAEVIALLLPEQPPQPESSLPLQQWMEQVIPQTKSAPSTTQLHELLISWWSNLNAHEVFVLNKVLTGAFRFGASEKLVIKGLAAACQVPEAVLTHRLMGEFRPNSAFYQQLTNLKSVQNTPSQPYPFFLASPVDEGKFKHEDFSNWIAEWKWDGIRAQVIKRANQIFIWSRGEDLVTHLFPEIEAACLKLPNGIVLDGEILCWQNNAPLSFSHLQKRLGRKRVSQALMAAYPVHFIAYDLLEHHGKDIRDLELRIRQHLLRQILTQYSSEQIHQFEASTFTSFEALSHLRSISQGKGAEGLVIKALNSPYLVGRKRGYWWKYKVDPMSLDAVLLYAQAGSGKRANLFTDYTFALWHEDKLVPFAKAYSGLDNAEIDELDKWIRRHTVEKFGPVRSVQPTYVFEIGFEGITSSKRHKSGISVRFPRILRWRKDKTIGEADTLQNAMALLNK